VDGLRRPPRGVCVMGLTRSNEAPEEWAERTAREQGLPAQVEDWAALADVAVLLSGTLRAGSGQTRHSGLTRDGSKRLRPRTAGPTVA